MSTISIISRGENSIRDFQQLVVDAVELSGSISPSLKTHLVSVLGSTFPSNVPPTTHHQKASLPVILRMLVYARHEADQFSTLRNARPTLDNFVAFLINYASYSRFGPGNRYH